MTVRITDAALDAVLAALDGYEAYRCSHHSDGEHGDETECEGWGPQGLADLNAGAVALTELSLRRPKLRGQERRMEVR